MCNTRHHPKHCDQAQRETTECVNPAEYVQYLPDLACSPGPVRREQGGGQAGGWRLRFGVPTYPWEPPTSAGSGFSHFLGLWKPGIYRAVSHRWVVLVVDSGPVPGTSVVRRGELCCR